MTRSDILNIAERVITGERQDAYGIPEDSFGRIADLWSAYLGVKVSSEDVAHMMVLLKIARTKGQEYHVDNYVDICGYAALAAEMAENKIKPDCGDWKVSGERNKKLLKKAEDEINRRLGEKFETEGSISSGDAASIAREVLIGED